MIIRTIEMGGFGIVIWWVLVAIVSSAIACERCVHQSKVAFHSTDDPLPFGACGYGSLATGFNGRRLASAPPSIFNNGTGCGSCIQMRCKMESICSKRGTTFLVTDLNNNDQTGFVLSKTAFMAMANNSTTSAQDLLNLGLADVEYKRVPCKYETRNLSIRVDESSQKPHYLSIKILYQGGQTEIRTIEVASVGTSDWVSLSKNHGVIWDTSKIPAGALQFRYGVTGGKSYWAKQVLPEDWANGVVYDSGLQITDVAQEACSPCDNSTWNSKPLLISELIL